MTTPSADQVALAIVMAAEAFGENPIAVASSDISSCARWHAFAGLHQAFPACAGKSLARYCGFPKPRFALRNYLANVVRSKWHRPLLVTDIASALRPERELSAEAVGEADLSDAPVTAERSPNIAEILESAPQSFGEPPKRHGGKGTLIPDLDKLSPLPRHVGRVASDYDLGDPIQGRSALAQRGGK